MNTISLTQRQQALEKAKNYILGEGRAQLGIGTLSEKTTHAVLKHTYCPDPFYHEVPIAGSIADICTGDEIIEIQSGGFHPLKNKLERFLPLMPVTIVHPIAHTKWLHWIHPETGEVSQRRKSPKQGSAVEIFKELIYLLPYLTDPNLHICIPLLDLEEYRVMDGWSKDGKKGSHRYDRIPLGIAQEIHLDCVNDYMQLIPYPLPDPFTSKDFQKASRLSPKMTGRALKVLRELQLIQQCGKEKNAYLYTIKELFSGQELDSSSNASS